MNIFFPDNIFTHSLVSHLNKAEGNKIIFSPSAVLSKRLNDEPDSLALIPTLEIMTNQEFYISKSVGVSFDGSLSNSYIYFGSDQEQINQVILAGDVSSMEVIMCKILFNELYNVEVELIISTKADEISEETHIIVGDNNLNNAKYEKGISFAEEVVELISAPYVNYVLASNNESLLKDYSKAILSNIKNFDLSKSELINQFDKGSSDFIIENSKSIIFDLDDQDIVGINELLRLPFFHGILKDLFDIKFV